ncbi:MAG TPA: transketolase C-terminal domain-containing protein [Verrucomicrobiota bacterium]|nr:transketolase C-terminal domain-containing protein [Verrucomicrobiota bacterium]
MAADPSSAVAPVDAPPLRPLALNSRLAATPKAAPKHAVKVKNAAGADVTLADPRASRALLALMNLHAVLGGAACHWGGPAAFAEIIASVHGIMFATTGREWYEAYNFVNDTGHAENGIYALRALYGFDGLTYEQLQGFRGIRSKLTGHGESHLNPEGVLLSNGPLSSALAQAQGLALGDRAAKRDRVTICTVSDGASMEGEAKEAFAAIPGLAAKGRLNPFVLIISDNDIKLSGHISSDAFTMEPTFAALSVLGWNTLTVPHGNDLQAVYLAIEKGIAAARAHPRQPVAILCKTVKGCGIKATEESATGGHGFPLKNGEKIVAWMRELFHNDAVPADILSWAESLHADWQKAEATRQARTGAPAPAKPRTDKVQAGLVRAVIRAATAGLPVFSVSSDVQGSTGISHFHQSFPDRFVEVGIAEANMISTGAGLSKAGFIAIVDTFGQFAITKGNLPLTMAALSQAPVIAIFSHVGFQDAADGASHQATTYFAATSAIPHTVVIAPSCADEAEALMEQAIQRFAADRAAGKDGESYLFFVGRENYPLTWIAGATYPWGKAQVLAHGQDVVLIGCGVLVNKAIEAGKLLAAQGVKATVINNPFINRVDLETIGGAVKTCGGRVVTIEDHQRIGGMGAQVSHALSCAGIAHTLTSLGVSGEFGQSAYVAEHLYEHHGLTAPKMAAAALALLGK